MFWLVIHHVDHFSHLHSIDRVAGISILAPCLLKNKIKSINTKPFQGKKNWSVAQVYFRQLQPIVHDFGKSQKTQTWVFSSLKRMVKVEKIDSGFFVAYMIGQSFLSHSIKGTERWHDYGPLWCATLACKISECGEKSISRKQFLWW